MPLVTVGPAMTCEGMPVRCGVLPGGRHDSRCVDRLRENSNHGRLDRIVGVMDRGMNSDESGDFLQKAGSRSISGEMPRGNPMSRMALSHPCPFEGAADTPEGGQVHAGEGTSCDGTAHSPQWPRPSGSPAGKTWNGGTAGSRS